MSEHRSENLKLFALEHGWKAQVKPVIPENPTINNIEWHLYALRDSETIHVWWIGERYIEGVYAYGEIRRNPARPGAVEKILAGQPPLEGTVRNVPWNDNPSAYDVMVAVLGKSITWTRRMDGEICNGHVSKESNLGKKHFKVYLHRNGMMLDWLDRDGFHTVMVEQIIQVG
jgi:hypothetical protein